MCGDGMNLVKLFNGIEERIQRQINIYIDIFNGRGDIVEYYRKDFFLRNGVWLIIYIG